MKMGSQLTKERLLEEIEAAYRQLERYIFYFEQDEEWARFSASEP
jgi:hypothetical protein